MPKKKRHKTCRRCCFRGVLVRKQNDQILQHAGLVSFELETGGYDTNHFHDPAGQPTRLTVTRKGKRVRLSANLELASDAPFYRVAILKNGGSAFFGMPAVDVSRSPDVRTLVNLTSAVVEVAPGDYFEIYLQGNVPNISIMATENTWFAMEEL
ncbi:MAG: hypothetical protein U0V70_10260 [Terriglobia bacterium]